MTEWPADKIEKWPTGKLRAYAKNSRVHSPEQLERIAGSVKEFGWTIPLLVDETGTILAGHARHMIAQRLKLPEVPVIVASGWSDAQKRAYVIADNRLTDLSTFDNDILIEELGLLSDDGFNLDIIGFSEQDLAALLHGSAPGDGLTDPDDAPEPPVTPVSVLGDVWVMGGHRLVCGDCTTVEAVDACLNGVKPHLLITDPPYGVEYDPEWRAKNPALKSTGKNRATGLIQNDHRSDWSEAWALFPGDVAYVWCAPGPLNCAVHDSLRDCDLIPRMQIVWAKSRMVLGRGHYHAMHENCWYAVRKSATAHWAGDRKQTTLWQIDHLKSETGHSAQKPVECMKRPIENNSSVGQAVYEPFAGSFTTGIACEITGRACHAIEISPQYVDVGVKRWMQFTGKPATHEQTGKTFDQLSAEREAK